MVWERIYRCEVFLTLVISCIRLRRNMASSWIWSFSRMSSRDPRGQYSVRRQQWGAVTLAPMKRTKWSWVTSFIWILCGRGLYKKREASETNEKQKKKEKRKRSKWIGSGLVYGPVDKEPGPFSHSISLALQPSYNPITRARDWFNRSVPIYRNLPASVPAVKGDSVPLCSWGWLWQPLSYPVVQIFPQKKRI